MICRLCCSRSLRGLDSGRMAGRPEVETDEGHATAPWHDEWALDGVYFWRSFSTLGMSSGTSTLTES
jgi:hypothetical protein